MVTCVKATIVRNASRDAFLFFIISTFFFLTITGCETETTGVIDPSYDTPYILSFNLSPEEINTDTILVNGEIDPDDSLRLTLNITAEIETRDAEDLSLYYRFKDNRSARPLSEGILTKLEHILPAVTINENLNIRIARSTVGQFSLTIRVETANGLYSNTVTRTVNVFRQNQPPQIMNVDAPDTIDTAEIGTGISLTMTVHVDDPDGVDDVVRVQTTNIQPDGNRVGPFILDKTEPGQFTITFEITPDAKKGAHRFEFIAFDRMNEQSEPYIHELEIK